MSDVIAYFLTWTTYGTWLRGDKRGWIDCVDDARTALREPHGELNRKDRERLKHNPTTLTPEMRRRVDTTVREVCQHRRWTMSALNVRSNHVHVVVSAAKDPDKMMADVKAWATRRLRESGLADGGNHLRTKHGSTKHIHSQTSLDDAIDYVMNQQDYPTHRLRSGLQRQPIPDVRSGS